MRLYIRDDEATLHAKGTQFAADFSSVIDIAPDQEIALRLATMTEINQWIRDTQTGKDDRIHLFASQPRLSKLWELNKTDDPIPDELRRLVLEGIPTEYKIKYDISLEAEKVWRIAKLEDIDDKWIIVARR